jgi:SAM-dependent methyltransferase
MKNPHFDDGLVVWQDAYSGCYQEPAAGYSDQFELQWRLCLDDQEYYQAPGASVDDEHICDRIYEWTGRRPRGPGAYDASAGSRPLDNPLDVNLIRGKECVDIGCGLGRWTKTMLEIGARSVLSIDVSESALASVSRFNSNVLNTNVMKIPVEHPELAGQFDFANLWGVVHHSHDPLLAFASAASTVKPGGALYLMVYAPEGMHGTKVVNLRRKCFAQLRTLDEKLAYVEDVYHRRWDTSLPLKENVKNVMRNALRRPKGSKIYALDMLAPCYNWVIPLDVIKGWMGKAGFERMRLLNEFEPKKCAYHVLGTKAVRRTQ